MAEPHDDPFTDSDLDDALEQAWGAKKKRGESVVAALERLPGVRSRVLLQEPLEEEAAPLLRVGAAEGPDRPTEDSRYQLVGEIARGGVGIIYRGRDRDLGRDVALKVLRTEHADKDVVVTRFVEEAQIGAQLQHPGIVPVYSLGLQPDGRPHFAMKLVKGRTLGALLEGRRNAAEDLRRFVGIFLQCCQTVSYAHARGVLHRDLKPANVMVGAFGEVLVVDWGFGKVLGREERVSKSEPVAKTVIATVRTGSEGSQSLVGSVMGTPAYMPPEQALGHVEELDARSDVFSLGAILCETLTGKPPYLGELRDLLVQAAQARLEPALERIDACDADDELKAIAHRCLQPVPGDRPADAGVVATAIGDWMARADERAERAEVEAVEEAARLERGRERAAWERRAKKKLRLGAVAAGLALLVGAGALWQVDANRHERADAARPAVEQALLEAARLDGQGELAAALGAAERARDLAQTGDVSPDLQEQAVARVGALQAGLDEQRAEADRAREAQAFAAELTNVHLGRWEGFNERHSDPEYARAFEARDLDPLEGDPQEVAARIRGRYAEVVADVVAGLDAWAALRWKFEREDWPWQPLLECARAVDSDPLREQIRLAMAARNDDALRALADEHGSEDLPGTTFQLLAAALGRMESRAGVDQRHTMLQERLVRHPDDFWVHAYLSFPRDPNDENDLERALDHATVAAALRPTSARARCQVATRLRDLRRYEQAFAVASDARRLAPDDAGVQGNYGVAAHDVRDFDEAERAWERACELNPRLAAPVLNLAGLYRRRGQPERTRKAFVRALELDAHSSAGYAGLAWALESLGRFEDALEYARKARDEDPLNADAWIAMARQLGRVHRRTEALEAARKAAALAPRRESVHVALSVALSQSGQPEEALVEAHTALRIDPLNAHAHSARGRALEALGDLEAAIISYEEALHLDPMLDHTPIRLGAAHMNLTRLAKAEPILRKYLAEHPTDEARGMLAQLLVAQQKPDEAEALLDQVAAGAGREEPCAAVFARAALHEARGEDTEAEAAYRALIEQDPYTAIHSFRLAKLLRRLQRFDEAIEVCEESLAQRRTQQLVCELGAVYADSGRLQEGMPLFEEALRLPGIDVDRAVAHLNIGQVLLKQGKPREGLAELEQVFDLAEGHPQIIDLADQMVRRARRQHQLIRLLPNILDGSLQLEGVEDLRIAWNLYWARDEREAARRVLAMVEEQLPEPHTWMGHHAGNCLKVCTEDDLRIPLTEGEDVTLKREACGLLERLVEAVHADAPDAEGARVWLRWIQARPTSSIVRVPSELARLEPQDRAAWAALWKAVDAIPSDTPADPSGEEADDAEGR